MIVVAGAPDTIKKELSGGGAPDAENLVRTCTEVHHLLRKRGFPEIAEMLVVFACEGDDAATIENKWLELMLDFMLQSGTPAAECQYKLVLHLLLHLLDLCCSVL